MTLCDQERHDVAPLNRGRLLCRLVELRRLGGLGDSGCASTTAVGLEYPPVKDESCKHNFVGFLPCFVWDFMNDIPWIDVLISFHEQ